MRDDLRRRIALYDANGRVGALQVRVRAVWKRSAIS